jgi:hypothetical protein
MYLRFYKVNNIFQTKIIHEELIVKIKWIKISGLKFLAIRNS